METTTQSLTIGEMSPEHFEAYITAIIKHVTDERFDRIEARLDQLNLNQDITGALVLKHDSRLREMAKS